MSPPEIPRPLVDAFRDRSAAVFVGAGVSSSAGLPGWQEIVSSLAQQLDLPEEDHSVDRLLKVPQYFANRLGRKALSKKLDELLQTTGSSSAHDLVARLPCDLFYTTNFDELLERSLYNRSVERFPVVVSESDAQYNSDRRGLQVRKVHGTISRPDGLVITRQDFAQVRSKNPVIVETLRNHLRSYTFLFIGYSLSDPDFAAIYDDVFLTMGEAHQKHFICAPAATEFEREDLRQRGLEVLDILDWDAARKDPSSGLVAFLEDLVTRTDDLAHLSRFFSGIEKSGHVPIIVSTQPHQDEKYIYVAECDLLVASQADNVLRQLGCSGRRIADHLALREFDDLIRGDVILVCSPFGNAFTQRVYEQGPARSDDNFSRVKFEQLGDMRAISVIDGPRFEAANPVGADGNVTQQEHALLARYPNPWSPGRSIFVLAGLHAIGTHAVGGFLASNDNFRDLPNDNGRLEAILTIEFSEHEPYDYQYEFSNVSVISS
jgi:hypothetical protein